MTYVDGFVLSVKKSKIPAYKKMAKEAGKLWMEKFQKLETPYYPKLEIKPPGGGF